MFQLRMVRRFAGFWLAGWLFISSAATAQTGGASQRDILQEITDVVGLKPRFELRATTQVQNAAAVVSNGHRFLLYNPRFVAAVNRAGHTDWAGISILAHEMGHHLNGHTLRPGGSQPADELEADEFSGFVLRKMGASLAQAQSAMAVAATESASATHPGRSNRLQAIGAGWQRADRQIVASSRQAAPSAQPAAVGSYRSAAPAVASRPVAVVGRIVFRNQQEAPYYLTNRLSIVRMAGNNAPQVVGHLMRSDSVQFPYLLIDNQNRKLFVSESGRIYNARGQQVGQVSSPS